MRYSVLGVSGVTVSRICFGGATLGADLEVNDAPRVIGRAIDLGVNFFDTASSYGNRPNSDRPGKPTAAQRLSSEEILGKALKGHRDEVVIATKVGERTGPDMTPRLNQGSQVNGPNGRWVFREPSLTRLYIMQQVEVSLRRLNTDHIDIYYAHHPDPMTPIEETLRVFDELIHQGKIRYYALSTFNGRRLTEVFWACDRLGLNRPICHTVPYNLEDRTIEPEVLPTSIKYNLPINPFFPLAAGLFAGMEGRTRSIAGMRRYGGAAFSDAQIDLATRFESLTDSWGYSPVQIALAWLMSKPGVASPVVGMDSIDEIESNVKAVDVQLDAEQIDLLDALNPPIMPTW